MSELFFCVSVLTAETHWDVELPQRMTGWCLVWELRNLKHSNPKIALSFFSLFSLSLFRLLTYFVFMPEQSHWLNCVHTHSLLEHELHRSKKIRLHKNIFTVWLQHLKERPLANGRPGDCTLSSFWTRAPPDHPNPTTFSKPQCCYNIAKEGEKNKKEETGPCQAISDTAHLDGGRASCISSFFFFFNFSFKWCNWSQLQTGCVCKFGQQHSNSWAASRLQPQALRRSVSVCLCVW